MPTDKEVFEQLGMNLVQAVYLLKGKVDTLQTTINPNTIQFTQPQKDALASGVTSALLQQIQNRINDLELDSTDLNHDVVGVLPIEYGGTGGTTPKEARDNLGITGGTVDISPHTNDFNNPHRVTPAQIRVLLDGRFVKNAGDLALEMEKKITFQEIFNSWERFRVGGVAGEENSWTYTSATDRVTCTVNSQGYIGFISKDSFETYSHESVISSNNNDNDMIGVVIAAYRESPTKLHTLTAVRVSAKPAESHCLSGGVAASWSICYNYGDSDAKIIANGNNMVTGNTGGWDKYPTGVKVKIERNRNIITAITSQLNSLTLDQGTILTVDLNSDPLLAKFKGPMRYGYSCLSQPNSTFSNIVFNDISSMIFDLLNKKIYIFKNGNWTIDGTQTFADLIGTDRFLFNNNTKKLFFFKDIDNIFDII